MVHFNPRRLQVFVSSTFLDLEMDRQRAVTTILSAGHIPAGMELFTPADESQLNVVYDWIDASDVFMLILGTRYGTVEPKSGKSYTQLEYEYAVKKQKPHFVCVMGEDEVNRRIRENGAAAIDDPKRSKEFKESICGGLLVSFWENSDQLENSIRRSLNEFEKRDDLFGWIRMDDSHDPAIAAELSRLSKENAELRALVNAGKQNPFDEFQFEDGEISLRHKNHDQTSRRWKEIFLAIAPKIVAWRPEGQIRVMISQFVATGQYTNDCEIVEEDLERIKIQFLSLGLIEVDVVNRDLGEPLDEHNRTLRRIRGIPRYYDISIWRLSDSGTRLLGHEMAAKK